MKLTVVGSSSTQVIATMDPIPEPGTYRLVVKAGKPSATAYVSIPSAPAVVATVAVFNQTAGIPVTTLYTPKTDGLYRFTIYVGCTTAGNTGGQYGLQLQWTDLFNIEYFAKYFRCGVNEAFVVNPAARLLTGDPLTYTVDDTNASGTYEMLITVESMMRTGTVLTQKQNSVFMVVKARMAEVPLAAKIRAK